VLFGGYPILFVAVVAAFFAAAAWESFRLFGRPHPRIGAAVWTVVFLLCVVVGGDLANNASLRILWALCALIWLLRLVPSLGLGLPAAGGIGNALLSTLYGIALLGAFVAIAQTHLVFGPLYLLSVMAIVWVADIGAYFAGRAFGKHKLAPSISPGKSWEGAVGGWLAVLMLTALCAWAAPRTFPAIIQQNWGWAGFVAVMTVLSAISVVGDLFESQLKRRAGAKDSSSLLPGHGGVLDRVDALIPVMPLAALLHLPLLRLIPTME
jgi:phosphatidate cytidylyltransferase